MVVTSNDLAAAIADACRTFDRPRAAALAAELASAIRSGRRVYAYDDETKRTLGRLRKNRYFDAVLAVAEALVESGQTAGEVRIAYSQALIDTGRLAAALAVLTDLLAVVARGSGAEMEARGLVGRVYKQLFVNGGGDDALRDDRLIRSFNAYYQAYTESPGRYWHGINAVALFERARRDGKALPAVEPFTEALERTTLALAAADPRDPWPIVTAGEAALALDRHDDAIARYTQFATSDPEMVGAFEIYSAYRQLIEVWALTEDREPGSTLLPMLRGALLERSGGDVTLIGADLRGDRGRVASIERKLEGSNEKIFSATMFRTLKWYRSGLERCDAVCRINDQQDAGIGTGFIVRGGDFHPALGDEKLVLTNAHVLSNTYPNALAEGDAVASFEALGDNGRYVLDRIVWSDLELDATLARASTPLPTCGTYQIARRLPANDQKQRVYVIGHPNGGGLTLSLNDNLLLDYDQRVAHYRAPTEGGSSGSPVFNSAWELIALHHWGDFNARRLNGQPGTYQANEGILISRIAEATRSGSMN